MLRLTSSLVALICLIVPSFTHAASIDLTKATIVIRQGNLPAAEKIAPTILTEEIARRTGVQWKVTTEWPASAEAIIAISTLAEPPAWNARIAETVSSVPKQAEAFSVTVTPAVKGQPTVVAVTGFDSRGAMFGVGKLLRSLQWKSGAVSLSSEFHAHESPSRPLRGHQIGYRDTANSWDAWTYEQFDQYFREMVIFGANAVENIPFQEDIVNRLMKYSREEMNVKFAELCEKYDLAHWVWVPVLIPLPDEAKEAEFLKQQEKFYRQIKRLDGVFVPGGDPGNNHAAVLLPFLERMAALLEKHHPKAKIWLSLQHHLNTPEDVKLVYDYLETKKPTWFGGLAMGPGSPPMELTRQRLPKQYQLRWYPDITHCVRCQYPVPWMDPAIGLTLGREPVNPRPVDYTDIYRADYSFTDGFLTYSDGVHDDFNKNLWSQLGWNPEADPRDIARDYARFFFRSDVAEEGADGLFALESDTRGPLAENGSMGATFTLWKDLEKRLPTSGSKWRFRMHLFRAYYAFFSRNRLLYENELERQALEKLVQVDKLGVKQTLQDARAILARATTQPNDPELIARLKAFGDELFADIGLQTSVPKYSASGTERGAVLDFLDYPLNNRWWLEDQFDAIEKMTDAKEQLKRLDAVRNWENPGEGGYYDVVGHVGRSPRLAKLLMFGDVVRHRAEFPIPVQRWLDVKRNGLRQAWHLYLDSFPHGLDYNDLDTTSPYIVKLFAQSDSPLLIDGVKAKLLKKGETYDRVTEQIFEVPLEATKDGRITLTWEALDQRHLNWRDWHYVTDIWVMKQPK
ncbi:hypothetical protein [Schlesneria paludicola]|uniref:hypothetical protein n=1 Tax=Schlesneria paludicola TaxID=360056 RepID=UPI00029A2F00|nr:hypothetical protein [Schlesneria paludicola]